MSNLDPNEICFAEIPTTAECIKGGHTGFTEEWGRVRVTGKRDGICYFLATGGRRPPGPYSCPLNYFFFLVTRWGSDDNEDLQLTRLDIDDE
jgi:hypothetical protein